MPDVFIPVDTSGYSNYFRELARKGVIYQYAFSFVDEHRKDLVGLKDYQSILKFIRTKDVIKGLVAYAKDKGVKPDYKGLAQSRNVIETQVKAYISRDVIDDDGYYPIIKDLDKTLLESRSLFQ